MAYDDITKTGAQSFRDLQLANNKDFATALATKKQELTYGYNNYAQSKEFDPYENAEQKVRSSLYGTPTAWGESNYDNTTTANANEFEQIQDIRANNQPWYSQLGAGLTKGVGLALTTFVDGSAGFILGGTKAIIQGDYSNIWNNEISNGLHDFNQAMEAWLPNYRTEEEQNGPWYKNLGTMNFWADSFLKNIGFTVGALYSGGIWTKGIKAAGRILQTAGRGMEVANAANKAAQITTRVGSGVESLGIAMQTNGLGAKLTGSLFSAINEGRIEANNNTADLRDIQVQQASDAFAKGRQTIIDDETLTDEDRITKMAALEGNYQVTLNKIDENLKKAGLTDFLLNVPILAIDNFWTFGRMYAQGFQNAKNVAGKNVRKSVSQLANEAADAAENTLAKNTKEEAGRYVWNEITKKKSIKKGLMTGLREGNEEMAQGMAAEFSGNWNFYKDGPDTYYRAVSNTNALKETMNAWEAASTSFANTYGNFDKYEEFAVGALTGLLGTPTFGRGQNSSANTWLGRDKKVGISGGLFGEMRSSAEMNDNGYAHVTNMNAALDKRDQIDKSARVHAAMGQFNDAMNGFAENDDKFEFHNESDNLDWMGITSFISTGREEDLKTLLNQDFENVSDEELESIAKFTSQNDGSNTGGFREKGSGKLITVTSPKEDKNNMRRKLAKQRDKMFDMIDSYKTSVDIIRNYAAGNPNVTEEEINELAWMHWKTNRFDKRAAEIKKDNAEQFTMITQALEAFKQTQQDILNQNEENTEGLSTAAMSTAENKNAKLFKAKEVAQKNIEYTDELLGIINSIARDNKAMMPLLAPMLQMDKGFLDEILKSDNFYDLAISRGLTKPEFDNVIRDIRDLSRLAEANKTFNDKLKEYMENPLKQKEDHEKIDQENEAVANEVNKENKRKKAKSATRQQILSGEVHVDDIINNTNTSDIERKLAQDAKITSQVSRRVEVMIAEQNQNGFLSDEEAAQIEDVIQQNISNSQSINDLTGSNAVFMVNSDGQPLSDEQISLIQSLIDGAVKEVAEIENLNITDGDIDFNKIDELIAADENDFTEKQTQEVEKAILKEDTDTTGNDAVEKAIAANSNGVQDVPKKASRKRRTDGDTGISKKQKGGKNNNTPQDQQVEKPKKKRRAATKAAEEVASSKAIVKKKVSIVSEALIFGINSNDLNAENDKIQIQLLSDILSKAYGLINKGKIKRLSGIMEVLKSMDEFEKLQQMLGRTPNLGSALKNLSDNLQKELIFEEEQQDDTIEDLEDELGPETTLGEKVDPKSFSSQDLNPVINISNYFAPATSQFYRDPKNGMILPVPFTATMKFGNTERKKKLETIYNYLTQNEAFKNASEVKAGESIYFTVHPNLNTAANDVIILMSTDPEGKHIVGDLADTDSYTYKNNTLLKAMADRITKEFNDRENKESSDPFVSKETSTVRQAMIGHVLFTEPKILSSNKTLNEVFGGGQFKLGVIDRTGEVLAENDEDNNSTSNLDVVTPKKRFTPGTPVVLIPTGKGTNKYVAVPFQMSKYNSSMRGTKFNSYVESTLKRVLLDSTGTPIDLSSNKAQVLVKNALHYLFNGDFHVNFNNNRLVIHKIIKTVNNGVTEKEKIIIFSGEHNANIFNNIIKAFQSKDMIIRIDRRKINKGGNLTDLDFTYNDMIGDLAHTNLSDKSSSTVNDWFIINPVNKDGEEINIDKVEYRDTRTEKGPVQRNDTKVTYNSKEYLVSEEGVVVDNDGNPRTDVNVTEQQIILAKAEIEKNDLAQPLGFEGEQTFWYSLGNGNLFYNKEGQEIVVVSETDRQAVKESLTKKIETPTTTKDTNQTKADSEKKEKKKKEEKEEEKNAYPEGFDRQSQKDFFDAMPKERQQLLMNANPNAISAMLPYINSIIRDFGIENLDEAEDDIDVIFDNLTNTKYRKTSEIEEYTPIDLETEKAWLKKALPQLSDDDHYRIYKGLIKISEKSNPGYAYGKTQQGMMTISDVAASGTVYHEAFHSVIDILLDENEINDLFIAGAKKYGIDIESLHDKIAIEENLAEDFRRYVQREQEYQKDLSQSSGISKLFKVLKHTVKTWLDNIFYINNMFYRINKGQMADRALQEAKRDTENNGMSGEQKEVSTQQSQFTEKEMANTTNNDIRYRKANITSEDIQQYHREKLDYSNLEESFKNTLEDRGITEEQYSFLTQAEKENMRLCLI